MGPILRVYVSIFANGTISITTFMISYKIGMNPLVALVAYIVIVIFFKVYLMIHNDDLSWSCINFTKYNTSSYLGLEVCFYSV
jgi:hypothetical protein